MLQESPSTSQLLAPTGPPIEGITLIRVQVGEPAILRGFRVFSLGRMVGARSLRYHGGSGDRGY